MLTDTAAHLIKAGANVDKWDWWGRSPLYLAVDYNTIPRGGRQDAPPLDETHLVGKLSNSFSTPEPTRKSAIETVFAVSIGRRGPRCG